MLRPLLLIAAIAFSTGCTSTYWIDRGRDAADIFTFAATPVIGFKGRVGPLSTGIALHDNTTVGLAAGQFGKVTSKASKYGKDFPCFELLVFGYDEFKPREIPKERDKGYDSAMVLFVNADKMEHRVVFAPFWTQIEVKVGLFVGAKVGFNPGEFLDFLLGFAGIDIYDDDLERRKNEEADQGPPPSDVPDL